MKTNKIMAVILEKSEDGKTPSVAKKDFEPALKKQCKQYKAFYYDDYLKDEECTFSIVPGKSLKDLQADVYLMAEKFKPDIIFFNIVKDEFNVKLLRELKKNYKTINWFSDDDWRWKNFSRDYCWEFSFVITTSLEAHYKYKTMGYKNSLCYSWGSSKFNTKVKKHRTYIFDVLFIGGWSKEREEIVDYLKQNNINITCYGTGWNNGSISQDKMEEYIYRSKINLNLSNSSFSLKIKIIDMCLKFIHESNLLCKIAAKVYLLKNKNRKKDMYQKKFHNEVKYFKTRAAVKATEQVKARHFEIPAFGGFQLSYYYSAILEVFDYGKNIVLFDTKESCLYKINYYLEHEEEREDIAMKGWKHCKAKYDYNIMFKKIIEEVTTI